MKIKLLIFAMLIGLTASAQPWKNRNAYALQSQDGNLDSVRLGWSTVGGYSYLPTTKMLRDVYIKKDQQPVNVLDYGAKPDGITDNTAFFQNATNTGRPVYIPAGVYKFTGIVYYTGTVKWKGEGKKTILKSDNDIIQIADGTNSSFTDLSLENVTDPYIIRRDSATFAITFRGYSSGLGYQPTVNDTDVWGSLTSAQQNQDIKPAIQFFGYSENLFISNITGRFAFVSLGPTSNSTIRDCNFQGGKGFFGGIAVGNTYLSPFRSKNNSIINNKVYYSSFSGIVLLSSSESIVEGNQVSFNGESGIKMYQGSFNGYDARCYNINVSNNLSYNNFYDGMDLQGDAPRTLLWDGRHTAVNNKIVHNNGAGIILDGKNTFVNSNYISNNNKDGINANAGIGTVISNNVLNNNNKQNISNGVHEININDGSNAIISNNDIFRSSIYNGYAIYSTNDITVKNNNAYNLDYLLGSSVFNIGNTHQNGAYKSRFGINTDKPVSDFEVNGITNLGNTSNLPDLNTSNTKYMITGVGINKWSFYNNPGSAVYGVGMSAATGFDNFAGDLGFAWYTGATNVDGTGAVLKAKISNNGDFNLSTLSGSNESLISATASGTIKRSSVDLSIFARRTGGNTFAGLQTFQDNVNFSGTSITSFNSAPQIKSGLDIYNTNSALTQILADNSVGGSAPSVSLTWPTTSGKFALLSDLSTYQTLGNLSSVISASSTLYPSNNAVINYTTGNFLKQGGNSFGAGMVIGTNDNQDVAIKRNGIVYQTITSAASSFGLPVRLTYANDGDANTAVKNSDLTGIANESILSKTANYAITQADLGNVNTTVVYANAASGNITITLPSVAISTGRKIVIFKTDATANTITITGAANINGSATYTVTPQYSSVEIHANGTQYYAK